MAMTEEEQIMGAEIRKTLMDALMGAGRMQRPEYENIDPGFTRGIPEGTPPSIPMPSPPIPQGYGNPETMDPGFTKWQYPPGTYSPRRPSEAEQMEQYYSPDEKRRMLEELWKRREIGREMERRPQQRGEMVPIPNAIPGSGEMVPIPRGSRGEMVPIPNAMPGGELGHSQQYQGERFSIGDLIRSFRESEKEF